MNELEQRIAIAEAATPADHIPGTGKIIKGEPIWLRNTPVGEMPFTCPDYPNNYGETIYAIQVLLTDKVQQSAFWYRLAEILNDDHRGEHRWLGPTAFHYATASPGQLCEALLKTLGLWKD